MVKFKILFVIFLFANFYWNSDLKVCAFVKLKKMFYFSNVFLLKFTSSFKYDKRNSQNVFFKEIRNSGIFNVVASFSIIFSLLIEAEPPISINSSQSRVILMQKNLFKTGLKLPLNQVNDFKHWFFYRIVFNCISNILLWIFHLFIVVVWYHIAVIADK